MENDFAAICAQDGPLDCCSSDCELLATCCDHSHSGLELRKCMDDLYASRDAIVDAAKLRRQLLDTAHLKATNYENTLHRVADWLPVCEKRLNGAAPVATDPRSLDVQLEEFKVCNRIFVNAILCKSECNKYINQLCIYIYIIG